MRHKEAFQETQFVVFSIHNELYSFSIAEVVEILRVPEVTEVPGIHEVIEGVINLRGAIIPIVNLHKRLQIERPAPTKKNRIVIVQGQGEHIGLMVEEVRMVTHFDEQDVEPTPGKQLEEDLFMKFAKMDGQIIGILNLHKLLYGFEK